MRYPGLGRGGSLPGTLGNFSGEGIARTGSLEPDLERWDGDMHELRPVGWGHVESSIKSRIETRRGSVCHRYSDHPHTMARSLYKALTHIRTPTSGTHKQKASAALASIENIHTHLF